MQEEIAQLKRVHFLHEEVTLLHNNLVFDIPGPSQKDERKCLTVSNGSIG